MLLSRAYHVSSLSTSSIIVFGLALRGARGSGKLTEVRADTARMRLIDTGRATSAVAGRNSCV